MSVLTFELEDDFTLIGIHSVLEDYRLAYLLNQNFGAKFRRFKDSLDFVNSTAVFPLFEFRDSTTEQDFYLINNKHTSLVEGEENNGLLGNQYTRLSYLVPEKKGVDFFLKIKGAKPAFSLKTVHKLNKINQVITAYLIDTDNLKSKNHLIF
ncbi:MAG: IPExxxVDY family protein [Lutibacter sp.]|jgi:hypothetical protein|nr:IPExxxVDY family protein [Lutibacter sp.]